NAMRPFRFLERDGPSEALGEAAVAQRAERIIAVQAGEHPPGLLGPRHRGRRRRPPDDLREAAFIDAVLAPRARVVLRARHLDERHVAGGWEAPDPVAVCVPGEVAGDVLAPVDDTRQGLAVVGVDPEVRARTVFGVEV